MKHFNWKRLLPHAIAVILFLIVALIYCKPALDGKVLQQSDVQQWKGMAQNSFDYKAKHGKLPLWTNGMFSGMPAYQIAIEPENPLTLTYISNLITIGLNKPAVFFFLAALCFYFLTQVLRVNPFAGMVGALAYAYATYNPVIIMVGHDTKMFAIAYMPFLIGAIILIYERRYWWGAALTGIAAALQIGQNHLQVTYYTFIAIGLMSIFYGVRWIMQKQFKHLILSAGLVIVAIVCGALVNSVLLGTTYEFSKETIRGGSVLASEKSANDKNGLNPSYALSYSMYKTEPFVMMFPFIYGGNSGFSQVGEENSKAVEAYREIPNNINAVVQQSNGQIPAGAVQQISQGVAQNLQGVMDIYWGGIGSTAGPAYSGAIICFLALLGFAVLDNKHKWWILATCILTFMMSWGSYLIGFNTFLLNNLPFYNKFRAPSMIIIVPTLLFAMMATLTLQQFISYTNKELIWKKYKQGLIIAGSAIVVALLIYFSADFTSAGDKETLKQIASIQDATQKQFIEPSAKAIINGLKEDRKSVMLNDIMRSLGFILVAAVMLFLAVKKRIHYGVTTAVIGLFAFIDLMTINVKYLNSETYLEPKEQSAEFPKSAADEQLLKDTSFYRVYDNTNGPHTAYNAGALRSYYHKSIGGYNPAKLSIYQDLIENQLYNFPNCMPVINMLNTKYVIQPTQGGSEEVIQNPANLGAVWFVKTIKYVNGPKAAMDALTTFNPKDTAIVEESFKANIPTAPQFDSTATISLINNDNDVVNYTSQSNSNQFAVFSEVYYNKGWKAYIDGKEAPIVKVNYVLRGLSVPAGKHDIKFEFKPASFYTGEKVAMFASALIWLALLGAIWQSIKSRKKETVIITETNK